jgi:tripartite-type tricarboxylate transporter receptor subunit TctC
MNAKITGLTSRSLVIFIFGLLAGTSSSIQAQSTVWPNKPVRLVVAFPPGGLADVMTRMLQPQLSEALGQPVVIDNRGGASGNIAAMELVRNGGDGHTFMVNVTTIESVNPLIFDRMPFDFGKDLQHVALLANTQLFLVTRPTLAVNNIKEFVAYAKANPGKLSYGSAGNGTTPHIAGELFKQSAGVFATHIPYRGVAPAIQDVMAGQIDFAFAPGTVFQNVKAGKLKLLGVASRKRTGNYPSAHTVSEEGFDNVFVDAPFAVYAPASMPVINVARMNREINRLLILPAIMARFSEVGADAIPMSPAEVKTLVQAETALFAPVVKARGIKSD